MALPGLFLPAYATPQDAWERRQAAIKMLGAAMQHLTGLLQLTALEPVALPAQHLLKRVSDDLLNMPRKLA